MRYPKPPKRAKAPRRSIRRHVVMFSGGVGSWAAALRVRERYPEGQIIALFADTRMEDEDLYRFLPEAAASVGAELVGQVDMFDLGGCGCFAGDAA